MFVVDEDVRIVEFNRAAAQFLREGREQILRQRGGDILHCIQSEVTPEGCGHAPACKECIIRNSGEDGRPGAANGPPEDQSGACNRGKVKELFMLITPPPSNMKATPGSMLIEDFTEL